MLILKAKTNTEPARQGLIGTRVRMRRAFIAGSYLAWSDVLTDAQRLTPVDSGFLRASAYETKPAADAVRGVIMIAFGASYAIYVHEIWKNYVVGEWKFLQTAVSLARPRLNSNIARFTRIYFEAGQSIDDVPQVHPSRPEARIKRGTNVGMNRHNRAALERMARSRRRKRGAKSREQMAIARAENRMRIEWESASSLRRQREGRAAPRPGRGLR